MRTSLSLEISGQSDSTAKRAPGPLYARTENREPCKYMPVWFCCLHRASMHLRLVCRRHRAQQCLYRCRQHLAWCALNPFLLSPREATPYSRNMRSRSGECGRHWGRAHRPGAPGGIVTMRGRQPGHHLQSYCLQGFATPLPSHKAPACRMLLMSLQRRVAGRSGGGDVQAAGVHG